MKTFPERSNHTRIQAGVIAHQDLSSTKHFYLLAFVGYWPICENLERIRRGNCLLPDGNIPPRWRRPHTSNQCRFDWSYHSPEHLRVAGSLSQIGVLSIPFCVTVMRQVGVPGRIRTCNLRLRRAMRYPIAPRGQEDGGSLPHLIKLLPCQHLIVSSLLFLVHIAFNFLLSRCVVAKTAIVRTPFALITLVLDPVDFRKRFVKRIAVTAM